MDRFPANGKLLKIYGRFLEYVRNDPWNASRCGGGWGSRGPLRTWPVLTGSDHYHQSADQLRDGHIENRAGLVGA